MPPGLSVSNGRSRMAVHIAKTTRIFLRTVLGLAFVFTGSMHFVVTDFMVRMMPPVLPAPRLLVFLSGIAEMLLGGCVFVAAARGVARWGLLLLLVAVFPANVYMAAVPEQFPEFSPEAIRWRLPFQALLMLWVWAGTLPDRTESSPE